MTCSAATPILTEEEIQERPGPLKGWSRAENWIERRYEFKNFLRAMSFVNAIAYLAESMSHHPVINVRYNRVTVRNWTHAAGGVTEHDFALAEQIEALARTGRGS